MARDGAQPDSAAAPTGAATPAPCIDVHCHLPAVDPLTDAIADFRRIGRAHGASRMILLGDVIRGGTHPDVATVTALNDSTLAACRTAPDLFSGLCYLNPEHGADFCLDEIDRCVVRGGLIGIKLWVAVNARKPAVDPIIARAADLGVPILHHAWYKTTTWVPDESEPADIAALAARHPRATIVMAHLGGGGWRGVRAIRAQPNVLVDTSGSYTEAGLVEFAVRALGPERVVFGSDMPGRDLGVQKARVAGADIPAAAKELLLRGNAERVFRLPAA